MAILKRIAEAPDKWVETRFFSRRRQQDPGEHA